jgi:hypothetical protein
MQFVVLAFLMVILFGMFVAMVIALLSVAAVAVGIGVPAYLLYRYWAGQPAMPGPRQRPMERLQQLYVDGKIDLFEFEQRMARLIAIEH